MRECLEAALEYARRGWPVLPLHTAAEGSCSCGKGSCASRGKHPRTRHGLKDATTDERTIRKLWSRWPDANVGVVTGKVSGLVVLDVDPRHSGDASLAELEQREGRLPRTVMALTGGGGRHILFAYPEGGVRTRAGLAPGLDVRSDGAFIVAPPSRHASGGKYAWELSRRPEEATLAPLPAWLIAPAGAQSTNGDAQVRRFEGGIPAGQRNDTLARLAGSMRRRGMSEAAIRAALRQENEVRCHPPLPIEEVDRIASSIARYEPDVAAAANVSMPQIDVSGQQDRDVLTAARKALLQADASLVYRDPGRLMRLEGTELRPIGHGELHDQLARSASWIRQTRNGITAATVPRRLLDALLAAPGPPIPTIRRVVRVPAFVEGFRLAAHPGRDGDTLFLGSPVALGELADEPAPEDVGQAVTTLRSWLAEFSFADETARAHAIALLITLLTRPAVPGNVPFFLIEAATPGTGKTTLAEVMCLAAYGELSVATPWTRDGEEMSKRAASWVLSGRPVVLLDDVSRVVGDPASVLSSLITTGSIEVRAMRELTVAGGRWGGVLIVTGNNVRLAEEMPRKACRIRLDSPEDPWTRTFRRADIHAWTLEHRPEIVRAVAVAVNAWKTIGSPPGSHVRPSFTGWAQSIGGILGCLGRDLADAFLDPQDVADMMTFGEGIEDLRGFVAAWNREGNHRLSAHNLVRVAERGGVLEDVMGDGNERSRASRLGRYLKGQRGKVVHGHRIVGAHDASAGAMKWSLETAAAVAEVGP